MMDYDNSKVEAIAGHYREILRLLGEDVDREGLLKTPERAAKAMLYATSGYGRTAAEVINGALFEAPGQGMIVVKNIEFYSLCEHHILPFFGHISIGYLPTDKIIGISKLARLADMFARRLQVQERFTEEVCAELMKSLDCRGVIARCEAHHMCMKMRGVEKQDSTTVTICKKGVFATDSSLAAEFLTSLR